MMESFIQNHTSLYIDYDNTLRIFMLPFIGIIISEKNILFMLRQNQGMT